MVVSEPDNGVDADVTGAVKGFELFQAGLMW